MNLDLNLSPQATKDEVAKVISDMLEEQGLHINQNIQKPWGGSFHIDEAQIQDFIDLYFNSDRGRISDGKLSPKILFVAPGKRLSWQYHHRRQELWKIVAGPVNYYLSDADTQPQTPQVAKVGEIIHVKRSTRHRLEGLKTWAVIAEIWSHTDPSHASDESDITRLQDDFGRENHQK